MSWLTQLFDSLGYMPKPITSERPSPKIRITPEQVHIENNTLIVPGLIGCYIAAIQPTNSMEPAIDDGMFVVLDPTVPANDLIIGDIIWFQSTSFEAIHRIITIGEDALGWFCQTQGDNNQYPDPVKVRSIDIRGVWRGTIS